ncbi:MAG: acyl-CoA/acyl-ACP dehydrogenase [Gammaproteobacteria bacterium]|nr:acyl-CoA/acyl-ACP dehydrogenase [Gammaproteobacteria bacterium]
MDRCERAREIVADAHGALDRAAARLNEDAQIELYDLAFSSAELRAAQILLEYAARDASPDEREFKEALALTFSAEAASNLHHRLRLRPSAYGLSAAELPNDYVELSDAYLSPSHLCAVGQAWRDRSGRLPDDHLDGEKSMIRETFHQFSDERVAPLAESIHCGNTMIPDTIIDGLRELGCFGLCVPERYGGLQPDDSEDRLGMVIVTEELSRGSLGAAGSLITRPEIMAQALLEGGSEAQKKRWLPGLAAGDPLCAVSVTEPGTGSDVAAVSLRAEKTEGGWLLNGGKTWCTFAGKAGAILVLARTDTDVRPAHRGLSLFVVEKPAYDGYEFEYAELRGGKVSGRAIPTIGYRGMHSFEMFYDDFFVPDDALVGESGGRGRGFYYTMRGFSGGRLQTAARASGLMRAAFEAALDYAENRIVFGRAVADYPLTLQKLARMGMYIVACRQFSYAVAERIDAGGGLETGRNDAQLAASLVKLFACKVAESVTREAMQIHGGMGYGEETAVSRYFVDARVLSIFEGAEETLALKVVGRALAGS